MGIELLTLRPEVAAFAQLMERRLRENDAEKGEDGWCDAKPTHLWNLLDDQSTELHTLVVDDGCDGCEAEGVKVEPAEIARRAANVANFAMMIADVCGALPKGGAS